MTQVSSRMQSASPCRVLLADDQTIFRAGTARVLEGESSMTVLGQCGAADQLLELVAMTRGSVLVLAQSLGADMDRLFAAAHVTATRVILMTDTASKPANPMLRRLDGLLTRQASAADLLNCVRRVGNGERVLQKQCRNRRRSGHQHPRCTVAARAADHRLRRAGLQEPPHRRRDRNQRAGGEKLPAHHLRQDRIQRQAGTGAVHAAPPSTGRSSSPRGRDPRTAPVAGLG